MAKRLKQLEGCVLCTAQLCMGNPS